MKSILEVSPSTAPVRVAILLLDGLLRKRMNAELRRSRGGEDRLDPLVFSEQALLPILE